jgi:hypothetical protein
VPDGLWKRVADALPKPIVWYKRKSFYGAVAAIAAIVIATCWFYTADNDCSQQCQDQLICSNSTQHNESTHINSLLTTDEKIVADNISQNNHTTTLKQAHTPHTTPAPVEVIEPTVLIAHIDDTQVVNNNEDAVSTDITTHNNNNINTDEPLIAHCHNNDAYYDDEALESISQNCYNDKLQSSFLSFDATTSGQRTVVTPFSSRCQNAEVTFAHKMPFSMRALFEKRFGRWGVGVGLSYTYMVADYEITHNIRQGQQELHYLGIPLYASFEFARVGKFAFYTSLGGQMDINTAGIQREEPESGAYNYFDKLEFREEALQFSAQLRVGAAFEVTKHLDIFIEPVLGYYFDNNSKVHSIWNDSPLSTSIAFGVRTWF